MAPVDEGPVPGSFDEFSFPQMPTPLIPPKPLEFPNRLPPEFFSFSQFSDRVVPTTELTRVGLKGPVIV